MSEGGCEFGAPFFALPPRGSPSPPWPASAAHCQRPQGTHGGPIMSPNLAGLPPRFLRTPEAARFLGLSGRTLEKHRTYGTGPAYRKLGGRVVYAIEDLQAWADRGAVTSTSDPRGSVLPAKRHGPAPVQAGRDRR